MEGSDPSGQIDVPNGFESGVLHHPRQLALIRESLDGIAQIVVRAGHAGDPRPDAREEVSEVEEEDVAEEGQRGARELEDGGDASGTEHAMDLPKSSGGRLQIPKAKSDGHGREEVIGEGQRERVALDQQDARPTSRDLCLPDAQHGTAEVHADDERLSGQLQCEIARAATEVKGERFWGGEIRAKLADRETPPATIHVEREQVIEEIVSGSDGREHAADALPMAARSARGFSPSRASFALPLLSHGK